MDATDFMKMYTTYVNGYARTMECINHLQSMLASFVICCDGEA
jgi:hypothetical protein